MKKLFLLIGFLLVPMLAHAVSLERTYGFGCDHTVFLGCTFAGSPPGSAAEALANMIANAVGALILTVAFIATVYGGYRIISSRGNSEGIEAGKKAIMWAIVGYFLATLVIQIVNFIIDFIRTVGA